MSKQILVVCTTDSMIWNFLRPHIENLQAQGCQVECACSRTGFFFEELRQKGLCLHELPFTRQPFHQENIKAVKELIRLIKQKEYDLIFCHEPVGGAAGGVAGLMTHTRCIYMAHGFHFTGARRERTG